MVWRGKKPRTIIMYILGGGIKSGSTFHTNMRYLCPELPLYSGSAISRGPSPNLRGWESDPTYPCTRTHTRVLTLLHDCQVIPHCQSWLHFIGIPMTYIEKNSVASEYSFTLIFLFIQNRRGIGVHSFIARVCCIT